jgi:hypothetical protein
MVCTAVEVLVLVLVLVWDGMVTERFWFGQVCDIHLIFAKL